MGRQYSTASLVFLYNLIFSKWSHHKPCLRARKKDIKEAVRCESQFRMLRETFTHASFLFTIVCYVK